MNRTVISCIAGVESLLLVASVVLVDLDRGGDFVKATLALVPVLTLASIALALHGRKRERVPAHRIILAGLGAIGAWGLLLFMDFAGPVTDELGMFALALILAASMAPIFVLLAYPKPQPDLPRYRPR